MFFGVGILMMTLVPFNLDSKVDLTVTSASILLRLTSVTFEMTLNGEMMFSVVR